MLIAGAREALKRLTEKGGGGHPDIRAGDRYARKSKQRKGGEGGRWAATELVAQIFGVSSRTVRRATQECSGEKVEEAKIRDPLARGPYALTEDGYRSKFHEDREKMIHAYNAMREAGETVSVPLMALALTDAGDAAAYVPMELYDPSEDEEERDPAFADAMALPAAADEEGEQAERGVDKSEYFK